MIRLLIADDQDLMREGLRMMMSAQEDIEVVAEARSGRELVEEARLRRPDVALVDIRMPGMDGIAATRELSSDLQSPRVVILTTFDHDDYVYDALRAGATGFLLKTTPSERLVAAVRGAAGGESLLSPEIARRLAERFASGPRPAPDGIPPALEELTPRERDVLRLIARGLGNADIADELVTSVATVKTHVNRVFRKLGVAERAQAVVLAYESGFVTAGSMGEEPPSRSCPSCA
jgi:DNA-binding NarL/FixJ family response regulator